MFNSQFKQILDLIDGETFIISDTHFSHESILKFEPSRNTQMLKDGFENHDEWLINQWNSVIAPNDVVLHLGDFAFKNIQEVQHKLNGRKILILGNHDRKGNQTYSAFEFVIKGLWVQAGITHDHYLHSAMTDELTSMLIKNINGKRVMFSHYPVCETELRWAEGRPPSKISDRLLIAKDLYYDYGCQVNVHGHTHSKCMVDRDTRVFKNVSLENIGMKPVKIKNII